MTTKFNAYQMNNDEKHHIATNGAHIELENKRQTDAAVKVTAKDFAKAYLDARDVLEEATIQPEPPTQGEEPPAEEGETIQ